jgi:hypothetical protein
MFCCLDSNSQGREYPLHRARARLLKGTDHWEEAFLDPSVEPHSPEVRTPSCWPCIQSCIRADELDTMYGWKPGGCMLSAVKGGVTLKGG